MTYLASFRQYSRAIHVCSKRYPSRLGGIVLLRHVIFQAYSGTFTKLHISSHIRRHWDSDIFRILAITFSNSVKLHFLFMTGSSFKSLFGSIWNIFDFCFKSNCLTFFLQDSISIITTVIKACHPR